MSEVKFDGFDQHLTDLQGRFDVHEATEVDANTSTVNASTPADSATEARALSGLALLTLHRPDLLRNMEQHAKNYFSEDPVSATHKENGKIDFFVTNQSLDTPTEEEDAHFTTGGRTLKDGDQIFNTISLSIAWTDPLHPQSGNQNLLLHEALHALIKIPRLWIDQGSSLPGFGESAEMNLTSAYRLFDGRQELFVASGLIQESQLDDISDDYRDGKSEEAREHFLIAMAEAAFMRPETFVAAAESISNSSCISEDPQAILLGLRDSLLDYFGYSGESGRTEAWGMARDMEQHLIRHWGS